GLTPFIVDVDSFAVQNAVEANYDFNPSEVAAILNIGSEITNIDIVQAGIPYFTKDLQLGGNTFIEAAQRKFNLSQVEAGAAVRGEAAQSPDMVPVIEQACEGLALALERAQAYLRTAGEAGAISRIVLGGTAFAQHSKMLSLTQQIAKADEESRALAPQIEKVNRLAQERAELDLRLGIISKLEHDRTLSVRILDEAATCMPDHLWLTML